MDKNIEGEARKLAEEHWDWIKGVLANRQAETKHMFIEGFVHGYKHGETMEKVLGESDKLVAELDKRYPPNLDSK